MSSFLKLAVTAPSQLKDLVIPKGGFYGSVKLDGVRCAIKDGQPITRTGKGINNDFIRRALSDSRLNGLDGELIVGEPFGNDVFKRTSSAVMSAKGEPDFRFYVFDDFLSHGGFEDRFESVKNKSRLSGYAIFHEQRLLPDLLNVSAFEEVAVRHLYEGIMLIPAGSTRPYPQGRTKDLIKVKRHKDTEAVVIGFKPLVRDTGEVCEMLGSLQCLLPNGKTFYMSGFNDKERVDIWHDQAGHLNRIVSFKYLEIGSYEVPRHPIFRGFRSL